MSSIRFSSVCLATLMVAACTHPPFGRRAEPSTPVVVEPVNPIPDSTGPGKSFGQPPAPAEKPPVKDPRLLIDLDLDETRSLLGEPTTVREEPPVTIWSYRTGECELNVFFYPNVQSRMLKALAYEVKAETQDERTESRCFEDLVRHHARSKS